MIFISYMILTILLFALLGGSKKVNTSTRMGIYYCLVMGVGMALIGALRSTEVGYDSGTYSRHFYECASMSWGQIMQEFGDEPGFFLLCKFTSLFFSNHQWIFAIVSCIISVSITRLIYRYSSNYMVSFLMLIPMMYLGFFLTALRQVLAFSLVLYGFTYAERKNIFLWAVIILIASLFHRSALLAFPLYFLSNRPLKLHHYGILILVFILVFVFRRYILSLFLRFIYTDYELYEKDAGTFATLFLYLGIWGVLLLFRNRKEIDHLVYYYEKALLIGILIQTFVPLEPTIYRLAFYYQIFSILIVPISVQAINDYFLRFCITIAFICIMFVMFIGFTYYSMGINPYYFFWQHPVIR